MVVILKKTKKLENSLHKQLYKHTEKKIIK